MHNRYVHHGHMYQGQEHVHRTCIQTSGSRIIHTCMLQDQSPGSQIGASYTHASELRIKNHRYVHHTHMHQIQGWRIIDMYLHHTCMYQDKGSWINASCICASQTHVSGSRIIQRCIVDICIPCIRDTCITDICMMDTCITDICMMDTCITDICMMDTCITDRCITDTCITGTCIMDQSGSPTD